MRDWVTWPEIPFQTECWHTHRRHISSFSPSGLMVFDKWNKITHACLGHMTKISFQFHGSWTNRHTWVKFQFCRSNLKINQKTKNNLTLVVKYVLRIEHWSVKYWSVMHKFFKLASDEHFQLMFQISRYFAQPFLRRSLRMKNGRIIIITRTAKRAHFLEASNLEMEQNHSCMTKSNEGVFLSLK